MTEAEQHAIDQASAAAAAARVCLGQVVAAHGVRGQVKIKPFTADPQSIAAYGPLTDEAGGRQFRLSVVGIAKGTVLARVDGITDRNAAEALRGVRLFVARAVLPPPAAEEYYHADLIGLDAERSNGAPLGRVVAVHDFGAGDMLEVVPVAGGATVMYPFTLAVVPTVDIARGRLVIEPMPEVVVPPSREPDDAAPDAAGETESAAVDNAAGAEQKERR